MFGLARCWREFHSHQLQVPMGTSAAANAGYLPAIRFPNNIFLKELSYRSSDPKHANFVVNEIKTLRRNVVARETERAERATLVRQAKLQLSSGRVHRLTGLWMLPTFGGRGGRKAGTLEAHANGLRFIGARVDEQADIMYENIRSCFFQPAKKEVKNAHSLPLEKSNHDREKRRLTTFNFIKKSSKRRKTWTAVAKTCTIQTKSRKNNENVRDKNECKKNLLSFANASRKSGKKISQKWV